MSENARQQYVKRIEELEGMLENLRRDLMEGDRTYAKDIAVMREQNDMMQLDHESAIETVNER